MKRRSISGPRVIAWCLLLLWMVFLLALSSVPSSNIPSAGETFIGKVIDYILRQGGHLLLHVVFGILVWRAARYTWVCRTALVVALNLALSYAVFDEVYQIFTPGRSVNVEDLAYNLTGGLIPYVLMWGQMLLPARLRTIWCRLMLLPEGQSKSIY